MADETFHSGPMCRKECGAALFYAGVKAVRISQLGSLRVRQRTRITRRIAGSCKN